LAARCGYVPSQISRVENGKLTASDGLRTAWIEACGVEAITWPKLRQKEEIDLLRAQVARLERTVARLERRLQSARRDEMPPGTRVLVADPRILVVDPYEVWLYLNHQIIVWWLGDGRFAANGDWDPATGQASIATLPTDDVRLIEAALTPPV
jgi:hypothetical protein